MHMFNMRLITREDCLRLAFALADWVEYSRLSTQYPIANNWFAEDMSGLQKAFKSSSK